MLNAKFRTDGFKFPTKEGRLKYEEELTKIARNAARVWLRAALHAVDGTFPVKSGMARASFTSLADYLNSLPGNKVAFDKSAGIDYMAVIPGVKDITQGRLQSKLSKFITILRNQYGAFRYTFNWWTNVEHFIRNETDPNAKAIFHLIHDTPWNVLSTASDAVSEYLPKAIENSHKIIVDNFRVVLTRQAK